MARLDSSVFPELSESVVAELQRHDILTAYDFLRAEKTEEAMKSGPSFKEIEKIRRSFCRKFGYVVENTSTVCERQLKPKVIPTGIQNLDALLDGGLRCGAIYEICGSSSAGKSQLCHWLSMHATTTDDSVEVHYIDGSSNFCVSRIQMMLDSRHCDNNMIGHVMSSIKVYQLFEVYELFSVLHSLANEDQSGSSKKLIIVDSLSVLFSVVTKEKLTPLLSEFASMCRYVVNHYEAVILIVNTVRTKQVSALPTEDEDETKFVLQVRPSLGFFWLSVPNVRLLMTQEESGQRKIAMWKSNQLLEPDRSCLLHIKDDGVFQS